MGGKQTKASNMKYTELTTEQWESVRHLLPPERTMQRGRPAKDNCIMLNAILYWMHTGVTWRDLPERYGPWQSVYGRLRSWVQQGIWKKVFRTLVAQDILEESAGMAEVFQREERQKALRRDGAKRTGR